MRAVAVSMLVAFLFLSGCGRGDDISLNLEGTETVSYVNANPEVISEKMYVYACGEVVRPGVYAVSGNTRVFEVIERAGGLSGNADAGSINLAETVSDGQKVCVPSKNRLSDGSQGTAAEADDGLVNINMADETELMTLTGVGQSRAQAIIAYREEHGSFGSIEDIKKVTGIKDGLFSKIKDQIKV